MFWISGCCRRVDGGWLGGARFYYVHCCPTLLSLFLIFCLHLDTCLIYPFCLCIYLHTYLDAAICGNHFTELISAEMSPLPDQQYYLDKSGGLIVVCLGVYSRPRPEFLTLVCITGMSLYVATECYTTTCMYIIARIIAKTLCEISLSSYPHALH